MTMGRSTKKRAIGHPRGVFMHPDYADVAQEEEDEKPR